MAHSAPAPGPAPAGPAGRRDVNPWAVGGITFAGVLLLVDGVLGVIKGITGIASDDVYVHVRDYTFKFDVTSWGWIHLVLGIVLGIVGWGILKGADWARATGVVIAAIGLIINFVWLPYQPVWALISVAIDAFVIWALCAGGPKAVI